MQFNSFVVLSLWSPSLMKSETSLQVHIPCKWILWRLHVTNLARTTSWNSIYWITKFKKQTSSACRFLWPWNCFLSFSWSDIWGSCIERDPSVVANLSWSLLGILSAQQRPFRGIVPKTSGTWCIWGENSGKSNLGRRLLCKDWLENRGLVGL